MGLIPRLVSIGIFPLALFAVVPKFIRAMGMSEDKFAAFSRRDLIYSSIKGHDLHATVLTPKISETQFNQPHPVVVHWHGGGFVTGHRMYGPWWSRWSVANSFPSHLPGRKKR